jgi:3-oxoacyl-[acyl-carrier protein] reductase
LPDNDYALVLGSSRGIGAAVARKLATGGRKVVTHGRTETEALVAMGVELGHQSIAFDCSNRDETRDGLRRLIDRHGVPAWVIYSVGINSTVPFEDMTAEDVLSIFGTNVFGAIYTYQYLLPRMVQNGKGAVVTVSSIRGNNVAASERIPAYSASKAALENLTVTLAKKYAPVVRVNAVSPGFTLTDMAATWNDTVRNQAKSGLLARPGLPGEIAAAVAYLLSDGAAYVTAQTMVVDGGYTVSMK